MPAARRSVIAVISILAAGGALSACSSASSSSTSTTTPAFSTGGGGAAPSGTRVGVGHTAGMERLVSGRVGESVSPAAPLIIRTGTVVLGVAKAHVVTVFDDVSSTAASMGGFVASSSSRAFGDAGSASLVVRVPSNDFGALVARVDSFGKVRSQSENGEDVTGESIDIQASLANLQSEETALRALISRAGSIASILQVQDQLFAVEGDIEQLTAEESSLVDRATFSTLTVDLMPLAAPAKPKPKPHEENAFVRAVKLAAHNTAVAARAVLAGIGWAFPLLLLALAGFAGWRLRRRTVRRRPAEPSLPPTA